MPPKVAEKLIVVPIACPIPYVALFPNIALSAILFPPRGAAGPKPGGAQVNPLLTCPNDIALPVAGNTAINPSVGSLFNVQHV